MRLIIWPGTVNDLGTCIKHGKPTLFADDTSIFISGRSMENIQSDIRDTVNQLSQWFQKNRLIINKEKTVAMHFHHIQNSTIDCPQIKLGAKSVTYANSTKFLGLWLDENLKWSIHVQTLTKKLSGLCFAIRMVR